MIETILYIVTALLCLLGLGVSAYNIRTSFKEVSDAKQEVEKTKNRLETLKNRK